MTLLHTFLTFIETLDSSLATLTIQYGNWIYGMLFLIIFCETGFIVTPFLPGDSLLFTAGALAAIGSLHIWWLFAILAIAAVLGDSVNYAIGRRLGPKIFFREHGLFLNKAHLDKTQQFYAKYGKKAIVLARFMPVIRTFAPFVAGVGKMDYRHFIVYNTIGGTAWIGFFLGLGYVFGNVSWVKSHFTLVLLCIIFLSFVPGIIEFVRHRLASNTHSS